MYRKVLSMVTVSHKLDLILVEPEPFHWLNMLFKSSIRSLLFIMVRKESYQHLFSVAAAFPVYVVCLWYGRDCCDTTWRLIESQVTETTKEIILFSIIMWYSWLLYVICQQWLQWENIIYRVARMHVAHIIAATVMMSMQMRPMTFS